VASDFPLVMAQPYRCVSGHPATGSIPNRDILQPPGGAEDALGCSIAISGVATRAPSGKPVQYTTLVLTRFIIFLADAARAVIAADGVIGLFGRGLSTRILANGLQGLLFSVLWELFMNL